MLHGERVAGKNATSGHIETRESSAAEKSYSQCLADREMRIRGTWGVRHSCLDSRQYLSEVLGEVTETGGNHSSEQDQSRFPLQSVVGGVAHKG